MASTEEDTGNALVVYSKFNTALSTVVQKTTALHKIRPENRVAVEGGMYVASCRNLSLHSSGFQGILVLTFYRDIDATTGNDNENILVEMVVNKFFRKTLTKSDIAHDGKKYAKAWSSASSAYPIWLIINGHVERELFGIMKAELINDRELLFSNDFIITLFYPIIKSLIEIHKNLGNF